MHNDSKLSSTLLPHVVEHVVAHVVEHDAAHIVEHVDEEEELCRCSTYPKAWMAMHMAMHQMFGTFQTCSTQCQWHICMPIT